MTTTWSIRDVAREAGVSSRTLRHYDEIGLLHPADVSPSGERRYGQAELVRLQQVLVLRELGLPLSEIAEALATDGGGGAATVDLLRTHHARLATEQERLGRLAASVRRTIDHLEEGSPVDPAEMFDGFDPVRQAAYEQELVDRYGEGVRDHLGESRRAVGAMSTDEVRDVQDGFADVERRMAVLLGDGVPPDDARVTAVLVDHHALVSRFWTPDAAAYAGLGEFYVSSPDFRDRYEAVRPGLAEYLRDAMAAYARDLLA